MKSQVHFQTNKSVTVDLYSSAAIGRASLMFILHDVGTGIPQPHFRSHVKSIEDFRLLQIIVIWIIYSLYK